MLSGGLLLGLLPSVQLLNPGKGDRNGVRTPMQWSAAPNAGFSTGTPWLAVHPNHVTLNAEQARQRATDATEAAQRGTHRVFLQVGAANAPALSLYAKAGLSQAWPYAYWKPLR